MGAGIRGRCSMFASYGPIFAVHEKPAPDFHGGRLGRAHCPEYRSSLAARKIFIHILRQGRLAPRAGLAGLCIDGQVRNRLNAGFWSCLSFSGFSYLIEPAADLGHRALSWTLGQTAMTSLMISPLSIEAGYKYTQAGSHGQCVAKMAELNDITSHIMLSQVRTRSSFEDGLGMQQSVRSTADVNAVAKIDHSLNQFAQSVARLWNADGAQRDDDDSARRRQRVLFDIR